VTSKACIATALIILGIISFEIFKLLASEENRNVAYLSIRFHKYMAEIFRFKNFTNGVLGFSGACSVIFWKMNDMFGEQWKYCCTLYNESLKTEGENAHWIRTGLVVDFVVVDLSVPLVT
jgi:hypothetical protein